MGMKGEGIFWYRFAEDNLSTVCLRISLFLVRRALHRFPACMQALKGYRLYKHETLVRSGFPGDQPPNQFPSRFPHVYASSWWRRNT